MIFLHENLRKHRLLKNLTQEDVAVFLNVTPQSVSKWERGECLPDITFLPALANIFETSIDALIGMDVIRAEETRFGIHKAAGEFQRKGQRCGRCFVFCILNAGNLTRQRRLRCSFRTPERAAKLYSLWC